MIDKPVTKPSAHAITQRALNGGKEPETVSLDEPKSFSAEIRMLLTISDIMTWVLMNYPQDNLSRSKCYELTERLNAIEKELLS